MSPKSLLAHLTHASDRILLCIWICLALAACGSQPRDVPTPGRPAPTLAALLLTPAVDSYRQSSGGGQPRSTGYWLLWNTCAEGNQAGTAKANGGRDAGWIVMDDLLADPGMLVGALEVAACPQGISLLQARDLSGADHANDPAYTLAAQLLAAQLNLAAGSASCPAAEEAVRGAHYLLLSLDFDGMGIYLGPPAGGQDRETALILTDQLSRYNTGAICMP